MVAKVPTKFPDPLGPLASKLAVDPTSPPPSSQVTTALVPAEKDSLFVVFQRFLGSGIGKSLVASIAVAVCAGLYYYFTHRKIEKSPITTSTSATKKSASKTKKPDAKTSKITKGDTKPAKDVPPESKSEPLKTETKPEVPSKSVEEMTPQERSEAAKTAKARGNKYFQGQQYEKALELYSESIRLAPSTDADLSVYYANRAACYHQMTGKESEVIADCTKALELNPKYAKAYLRRATAYEQQQKFHDALYDFTAVSLLESLQNEKALKSADRVLIEIGKAEAAERMKTKKTHLPSYHFITSYLDTFVEREYEHPPTIPENSESQEADATYIKALELIRDRKYDDAFVAINQALEAKTTFLARALNWRGTFIYLQGDLDASLVDLDASLELDPKNINSLIKRGSIQIEKQNFDASLEDFEKALAIENNNADIYFHRGQVYFLTSKLDEAIHDYEKAISLNSSLPLAYIQLAVAHFRLQNVSRALEVFQQAELKFPNSADICNYYGEVLIALEKLDDALTKFEKAISLAPENPIAYINKGHLFFRQQKIDEAIEWVEKAIKIDERSDIGYAHLAQFYSQTNNPTRAAECYDKAADLARSENEMAAFIGLRVATTTQFAVMSKLGLPTLPNFLNMQ